MSGAVYGAGKLSSGAQNDEISFDVVLAPGTWTIKIMLCRGKYFGIYSVSLGGVAVGTFDGYYNPGHDQPVTNYRVEFSGVNVAAAGKVRLTIKMSDKNASALAYKGSLQHIAFQRTA